MLTAKCPDCGTSHSLRDDLQGKRIKCKKCLVPFTVRGQSSEENEAVRASGERPRAASRRDEPRDDRDDDADDRPIRRKPRPRNESSNAGLVWGLAIGGSLLLIVTIGGVITWAVMSRPPEPPPPIVQIGGPDGMKIQMQIPKGFPIQPGGNVPNVNINLGGGNQEIDWRKDRHVKRKVQLNCKSMETRAILFPAEQTDQAIVGATVMKIDFNNPKPPSQQFDRFDLAKKVPLSTVSRDELGTEEAVDSSPDGNAMLVRINGKLAIWSFANRQFLARDMELKYPRKDPFRVHEVGAAWVGFLDNQRLLAVYDDGAVDAWTFPNLQRAPLFTPQQDNNGVIDWKIRPKMDAFSRVPQSFAFSRDRGTLALFNATGFHLIDVRTGQKRSTTPADNASGEAIEPSAVTFSPDGSQLAAILGLNVQKGGFSRKQYLLRWDARTGQKQLQVELPAEANFDFWKGFTYWSPQHLAIVNEKSIHVLRADTGAYVAKGVGNQFDTKFLPCPGDGLVTVLSSPGVFGNAFLLAVECPEAALAGNRQFTLNYHGLASP